MDFIIVGAGCAGLVLAAQLKRRLPSSTFMILERSPSLGGTWYQNTYPGCAVDMPCVTYIEILRYLHDVAARFNIHESLTLNAEVVSARWDDDTQMWTVAYKVEQSSEIIEQQSKILVSAIGQLAEPTYGGIQGLEKFKGDILHCNQWKSNANLDDKHVVVVGNGASGAQVVPSIVQRVRHLTQLIRAPQGYSERQNPRLSSTTVWMFKYIPFYLRMWRYWNFWLLESRFPQFHHDPRGEMIRKKNMEAYIEYTKATAPEKYWNLVLPHYERSCKRVIGDFGYLASLNAANLDLIHDAVVECDETGVLTQSGAHYGADAVIFATGYKSNLAHLNITGRNGVSLAEKWGTEFKSHYQTISVSGFPNFFMLYGPNSAPPNMSAIFCFENYVDLILKVVDPILSKQATSAEPDPQREADYIADLRQTLDEGVWESCKQRTKDPRQNVLMYPWSNTTMYWHTHGATKGSWIYQSFQDKETP